MLKNCTDIFDLKSDKFLTYRFANFKLIVIAFDITLDWCNSVTSMHSAGKKQ